MGVSKSKLLRVAGMEVAMESGMEETKYSQYNIYEVYVWARVGRIRRSFSLGVGNVLSYSAVSNFFRFCKRDEATQELSSYVYS
jgi:hypothetical protein